MSTETLQQRIDREAREDDLCEDLAYKPRLRYQSRSIARKIKIGGDYYSLAWIVTYATARNQGVRCMYTSGICATLRLEQVMGVREWHDVGSKDVDAQLLWQANLFWIKRQQKDRKCKPKKHLYNSAPVSAGRPIATPSC